jgi:hypothetical protein
MTHEYDDPIGSEQLEEAVRYIAERYRAEDRDLAGLVGEVVTERFCSCVAAPDTAGASVRWIDRGGVQTGSCPTC